MKFSEIAEILRGDIVFDNEEDDNIEDVVASDLMSEVLVVEKEVDFILMTSLASDQAVRTADIVGAAGIVLLNGKKPPSNLKALAEEMDISVMTTKKSCFDACLLMGGALGKCPDRNE